MTKPVVLVIEDDRLTQTFMRAALRGEFDLLFAADATEARAALAANGDRLSAVLMDLSLEGDEDGLSLTRFIRSDPRWKDLPIIATTAHALSEDRKNSLDAGCSAYLAKPIDPKTLVGLIGRLLAARSGDGSR